MKPLKNVATVIDQFRAQIGLGLLDWYLGPPGYLLQNSGSSLQFTVTDDSESPVWNMRRKKTTGNGDVTIGGRINESMNVAENKDEYRMSVFYVIRTTNLCEATS